MMRERRCKVHDGFPMPNGRSCSVAAFGPWDDECVWVEVLVIEADRIERITPKGDYTILVVDDEQETDDE